MKRIFAGERAGVRNCQGILRHPVASNIGMFLSLQVSRGNQRKESVRKPAVTESIVTDAAAIRASPEPGKIGQGESMISLYCLLLFNVLLEQPIGQTHPEASEQRG